MSQPGALAGEHVRILFRLEKGADDYPPAEVERLWARTLEDGSFEIDNIPFFVRDISVGDVVSARSQEGEWEFSELLRASGNSTLRVIVFDPAQVASTREYLQAQGCSSELHTSKLLSVDVPAQVDLWAIRDWLSRQEAAGLLEFEDACLRHAERLNAVHEKRD